MIVGTWWGYDGFVAFLAIPEGDFGAIISTSADGPVAANAGNPVNQNLSVLCREKGHLVNNGSEVIDVL